MKYIKYSLWLVAACWSVGFLQAQYLSAPQYWGQLQKAFFNASPTAWNTHYYQRGERRRHLNAVRFSREFFGSSAVEEDEKGNDLELFDKTMLVMVDPQSMNDEGVIFRIENKNRLFDFDRIELEIHSKYLPPDKSQILVQGFGGQSFFNAEGKTTLWIPQGYESGEIILKNTSDEPLSEVKMRVKKVWIKHKYSDRLVLSRLVGNTLSYLWNIDAKKDDLNVVVNTEKSVKNRVVTPSEVVDILSFSYVPNQENEILKSVKIHDVLRNFSPKSVFKKMVLYEKKSNKVLSEFVPNNEPSVQFLIQNSYKIDKTDVNEFRIRAYFRDNFPVFEYSNELRWSVNASDFALVASSGHKPVPVSNKTLSINSATLSLQDSRLAVISENSGQVVFKNIGKKNSYLYQTAFVLPEYEPEKESIVVTRQYQSLPPYNLIFSGNVMRIEFQDPLKIRPNENLVLDVLRSSEKPSTFVRAERDAKIDTLYNLKYQKSYHIWVGNTNWYERYEPVWMNGAFLDMSDLNLFEKK